MSRRSGRGHIKSEAALEKIGVGRSGMIELLRQAKIGSPLYKRLSSAVDVIDDVVEELTGDRTHFHAKPGSTAPREDHPARR